MDLYYINLYKIPLKEYQETLQNKDILPGRKILKLNIDDNFQRLKEHGINNLGELINELKTSNKIEQFAKKTQLSVEYLTILRRDANAYISKPVNLKEFPSVSKSLIIKLAEHGILHTKHYFDLTIREEDRKNMMRITKSSMEEITKLSKLSNLVRINGVGAVFAVMLFDAAIDTIEKIVEGDPKKLYEKLVALNEQKKYTNATFVFNDILYIKRFAEKLPLITKY